MDPNELEVLPMKDLTYTEHGKFALVDKSEPLILDPRDAVVRMTLGSICTSDLHIKHGSVPRAVPGITVGHEMVDVVEEIGSAVTSVLPGDRVTVAQTNSRIKHIKIPFKSTITRSLISGSMIVRSN